jgi:membrane-associated phospholipid phosphatase
MFQTDPILYLQSLGNEWVTTLMLWVTTLGYSEFQGPLLIVIMFGINIRKGILLIHMLTWNAVLTDFAKEFFALPRPPDVDSAVRHMGSDVENMAPFQGRGARGFWSALDPDIVKHYRSVPDVSWGFPSGHVSGTTTLWGGLCVLFQSVPLRVVAVALVLLMPISRMYLGRHFLADAIGGLVLGGAIVAGVYVFLLRSGRRARRFEEQDRSADRGVWFIALVAYLLLIPFALLFLFPNYEADAAGRLLGFDLAYVAIVIIGLPAETASLTRRILRVVAAGAIFLGTSFLFDQSISAAKLAETSLVEFVGGALPAFFCILLTIVGGIKMGLYSSAVKPG